MKKDLEKQKLKNVEAALKRVFQENEKGKRVETFENELEADLMLYAEKINAEKGLSYDKPQKSESRQNSSSLLQTFVMYLSIFTVLGLFGIGVGVTYLVYKGDLVLTGGQIAVNPDQSGEKEKVENIKKKINNNFAVENGTNYTFDSLIIPIEGADICADVCDAKTALQVIKSRFGDLYSFQSTLTYTDQTNSNYEYYYFFTNRELNTRRLQLKDNSEISISNTSNVNIYEGSQLDEFFNKKTNTDVLKILNQIESLYGAYNKLEFNNQSGNRKFTINYVAVQNSNNPALQIELFTDDALLVTRMLVTVYDQNGVITDYFNYRYSNFNVSNANVLKPEDIEEINHNDEIAEIEGADKSEKNMTILTASTVNELLNLVSEYSVFKVYGEMNDPKLNNVNFKEWGNAVKVSSDDIETVYNADLKTFSELGYYQFILLDNNRYKRKYDFNESIWGNYTQVEFDEYYKDSYLSDLSPKYVLAKYSTGDFSVNNLKCVEEYARNIYICKLNSVDAEFDYTFDGEFWINYSGEIIRQQYSLISAKQAKALESKSMNYFEVLDEQKVREEIKL